METVYTCASPCAWSAYSVVHALHYLAQAEGLVLNSDAQRDQARRLDAMEEAIAQTPHAAPAQAQMRGHAVHSPEFKEVPLTSP